jgi:Phospholipid methyltransferase
VTTGFDRYIRHPSYLGAVLGMGGWVLVFRRGIGLVLVAPMILMTLPILGAGEALLLSEFGEEYAAYRRRTWRLVPLFIEGRPERARRGFRARRGPSARRSDRPDSVIGSGVQASGPTAGSGDLGSPCRAVLPYRNLVSDRA